MARDVNEKDWRLFRSQLPDWQEAYMEKVVEEYKILLDSREPASGKFWALDERIRQDKRNPGVLLRDVRRTNLETHLLQLLRYEVIRPDDLNGFSQELRERIIWIQENV